MPSIQLISDAQLTTLRRAKIDLGRGIGSQSLSTDAQDAIDDLDALGRVTELLRTQQRNEGSERLFESILRRPGTPAPIAPADAPVLPRTAFPLPQPEDCGPSFRSQRDVLLTAFAIDLARKSETPVLTELAEQFLANRFGTLEREPLRALPEFEPVGSLPGLTPFRPNILYAPIPTDLLCDAEAAACRMEIVQWAKAAVADLWFRGIDNVVPRCIRLDTLANQPRNGIVFRARATRPGGSFGPQSDSLRLFFGTLDITGRITDWQDREISFTLPSGIAATTLRSGPLFLRNAQSLLGSSWSGFEKACGVLGRFEATPEGQPFLQPHPTSSHRRPGIDRDSGSAGDTPFRLSRSTVPGRRQGRVREVPEGAIRVAGRA